MSLLADLNRDHHHATILLNILASECNHLNRGERHSDFELIHYIMTYMTEYADAVHHPKEEILFARLKSTSPEIDQILNGLGLEHEQLREHGHAILEMVGRVLAERLVERDVLRNELNRYIALYRAHIVTEEQDVFPLGKDTLSAEEWAALTVEYQDKTDPVFGSVLDEHYSKLYKTLSQLGTFDSL